MIKLWLKLVWNLRTPFIFLLDNNYNEITRDDINNIYKIVSNYIYIHNFFDCDDFAIVFKAEASKAKIDGVGLVFGYLNKSSHAWNCLLMDGAVWQYEPQNNILFKANSDYKPLVVII